MRTPISPVCLTTIYRFWMTGALTLECFVGAELTCVSGPDHLSRCQPVMHLHRTHRYNKLVEKYPTCGRIITSGAREEPTPRPAAAAPSTLEPQPASALPSGAEDYYMRKS